MDAPIGLFSDGSITRGARFLGVYLWSRAQPLPGLALRPRPIHIHKRTVRDALGGVARGTFDRYLRELRHAGWVRTLPRETPGRITLRLELCSLAEQRAVALVLGSAEERAREEGASSRKD